MLIVSVSFTESEKQYPSACGFVKQLIPLSIKSFYLCINGLPLSRLQLQSSSNFNHTGDVLWSVSGRLGVSRMSVMSGQTNAVSSARTKREKTTGSD